MDQAAKVRPRGVIVVAILMGWSGLLTIASIFPPFGPGGLPKWAMTIDIVIGIAMLGIAWGLYGLRMWAYIVTMAMQAINGLFAIVAVVAMPRAWPAWVAILIAALIIVYLLRPQVRSAFGIMQEI